jgi:hypothetical protein
MTTTSTATRIQATRGAQTVHFGWMNREQWFTKCGQNQMRTVQGKTVYKPTEAGVTCPKCAAQWGE